MGYCVNIEMDDVVIPADKVDDCLAAINEMFTDENLTKHGSGCAGGPSITEDTPVREKHWYSWVHNPKDKGFETLLEAIGAWRYQAEQKDNGDIEILYFDGDKWGDDEQFYTIITPFVLDNAFIECRGEGGERWRYKFENGEMKEEHAMISWE